MHKTFYWVHSLNSSKDFSRTMQDAKFSLQLLAVALQSLIVFEIWNLILYSKIENFQNWGCFCQLFLSLHITRKLSRSRQSSRISNKRFKNAKTVILIKYQSLVDTISHSVLIFLVESIFYCIFSDLFTKFKTKILLKNIKNLGKHITWFSGLKTDTFTDKRWRSPFFKPWKN